MLEKPRLLHFKDDTNKLGNALSLNVTLLKWIGVWPAVDPKSKREAFINGIRRFFVLYTTMYFFSLCQLVFIIQNYDNIADVLKCLTLATSNMMTVFKVEVFMRKPIFLKNTFEMIQCLENSSFVRNPKADDYITLSCRNSKWATVVLLTLGILTAIAAAFIPLLSDTEMMFLTWYPLASGDNKINGTALYLHQALTSFVMAIVSISIDTYISGLLGMMAGQLDVTNCELENLVDVSISMYEDVNIVRDKDKFLSKNEAFQNILNDNFKKCVSRHQYAIGFIKYLNEGFGPILFIHVSVCSVMICATMFLFTILDFSVEFMAYLAFFLVITEQIFLFCWYGNEIQWKSNKLVKSAMLSDWINFSVNSRRNFILLLLMNCKEIQIKVGQFIVLNLQTFLQIMRTSWSYFTLLQSIQ